MSDWYKVRRRDVVAHGGSGLFKSHTSLYEALSAVYPDYQWEYLNFVDSASKIKNGFWDSLENQKKFLDKVAQELGITEVTILCYLLFICAVGCFVPCCSEY